jgi:hypothetical protein
MIDFTDLISGGLRRWQYKLNRRVPIGDSERLQQLVCITDYQGNKSREPTVTQASKGKTVGNPLTLNCFVCRRYLYNGKQKQQTTSWWCKDCNMPICRADRSIEGSLRQHSCLKEHLTSNESVLGCVMKHAKEMPVLEHLHVNLKERRSKRNQS